MERCKEATKVQSVCDTVVVRIGLHPEPHSTENCIMVNCGASKNRGRRFDGENAFEMLLRE